MFENRQRFLDKKLFTFFLAILYPLGGLQGAEPTRAIQLDPNASLLLHPTAETPDLPLGCYKLVTSFVEARIHEETFSLASGDAAAGGRVTRTTYHAAAARAKDSGRLLASLTTLRFSSLSEKGDQEDVDPDPGSVTFTDPGRSAAVRVLHYEATCRRPPWDEVDDHGDTPACATPLELGRSAAGEIGNGHGDDVDVFVLSLTELTTIELATTGEADSFGVLSDRFGQRLAMDDDGTGDHNFRIVSTLAPGRYFIRIESGGGAGGAYQLTARAPGG